MSEPLSTSLSNPAGIDNRWTCPACYADHVGILEDSVIACECGRSFKATLEYEPVCHSRLVDPNEEGDEG